MTPLNSTTTADSHAATQDRMVADATSLPPTKVTIQSPSSFFPLLCHSHSALTRLPTTRSARETTM